MEHSSQVNRWRLILGKPAAGELAFSPGAALENGVPCAELEEILKKRREARAHSDGDTYSG